MLSCQGQRCAPSAGWGWGGFPSWVPTGLLGVHDPEGSVPGIRWKSHMLMSHGVFARTPTDPSSLTVERSP